MGWFTGKSEAEKAAEQVDDSRRAAKSNAAIGQAAKAAGAKRIGAALEAGARRDAQVADEIESDGRVKGWW